MIEEKLKWSEEDVRKRLSKQVFKDHHLYGMIQRCFAASPFQAIDAAYPGVYRNWELLRVSNNFWNEDTYIEAFRHLVEDCLQIPQGQDVRPHITLKLLRANNLWVIKEEYGIHGIIKLYYEKYGIKL